MAEPRFKIRPDVTIHWSMRGSCGNPGCTDPECCCSFCGLPIGAREDDPRYETHGEEDCYDPNCELCVDRVPLVLFRGEGKQLEQAQFHDACFRQIINWRGAEARSTVQ
jgi:hypothetical protein